MADNHKTQQPEDDDHEKQQKAIHLKTLAESKYTSSSGAAVKSALKYARRAHRLFPTLPGLLEVLTAFQILHSAAAKTTATHYSILGLDPFSPITSIKAQYKKLSLLLHHPDNKNILQNALNEAFKLVNDAFHVLSDRNRRKECDTKLRELTFWTACSRCQLMHKFERKYVGDNMICPNCNQGFKAVEVSDEEGNGSVRRSARVRVKVRNNIAEGRSKNDGEKGVLSLKLVNSKGKKKEGSLNEVFGKVKSKRVDMPMVEGNKDRTQLGLGREKLKNGNRKQGRSEVVEVSEEEEKVERELTLAEMKFETLKKLKGKKVKMREESEVINKDRRLLSLVESRDMEVMAVEDSDFYDFDEDRVERSFKKGQVWAIYDDDDGMPRHYGLIDEVVSVNPFEVKMSWLDVQSHGDEQLLCLEKTGFQFHVSCGRFKVARKDTMSLLNIFSHLVECERASRELYRVYPRKGSVWALYNEQTLGRDRRNYDIVVLLTSYSEMHGLSMAYLEKVDGFRAVFRRREIGYHAIRWLEKGDIMLFSHQIPARKLSGNEAPDISGDCWELDPASLPPNLLAITWRK